MKNIPIFVSPKYVDELHLALLSTQFHHFVQVECPPTPVIQAAPQQLLGMLSETNGALGSFTLAGWRILIRDHAFLTPKCLCPVLSHELLHAERAQNSNWQSYCAMRSGIMQQFRAKADSDTLMGFLSPPFEWDINRVVFHRYPEFALEQNNGVRESLKEPLPGIESDATVDAYSMVMHVLKTLYIVKRCGMDPEYLQLHAYVMWVLDQLALKRRVDVRSEVDALVATTDWYLYLDTARRVLTLFYP